MSVALTRGRRRTGRPWCIALCALALVIASCSDDAGSGGVDTSSAATAGPTNATEPADATGAPGAPGASAPDTSSVDAARVSSAPVDDPRCDPGDPGDVVVWHSFGGDVAMDEFDRLIAEYGKANGVTIRSEKVGGYIEMIARLAESDLADWPDIVVGPTTATRTLLDSQRFVPPAACGDPSVFVDDMLPVVRSTYSVGDELVAVPYGVSAPVLFYDRARFRAAGLDPDRPPATLEELIDDSATLVDTGASPYGLVLDDHILQWIIQQYAARRGELLSEPDNGRTGEVSLDLVDDQVLADIATVQAGIDAGHVRWLGPNPSSFDDLLAIVDPDQPSAMTLHTSGSIGDVIAFMESGNFPGVELGVAPLPGPGTGSTVGGNALWLVDSGDPARVGAAWQLASWLFDAPQLARFVAATGYVPATTSAAADPTLTARWQVYPQLRVAFDQLADTPGGDATGGLVLGPADEFADALFDAANAIYGTGADPVATLESVEQAIDALVQQYPSI